MALDPAHRDAFRMAVSGQCAEPVELTLGPDDGLTTHYAEDTHMPEADGHSGDVDGSQVIDLLVGQIADQAKTNAILTVMVQAKDARIAQLEQAVRDGGSA